MRDEADLELLEEILALERASIIRYIIEVAHPPVVDEEDQKCLIAYQDYYRDTQRAIERMEGLLLDEGIEPDDIPRWPLRFSHFNYVRPRALLPRVLSEAENHLRRLKELAEGLRPREDGGGWPEAFAAVEESIQKHEERIEDLRRLASEIPELKPDAPTLKGTSAAHW